MPIICKFRVPRTAALGFNRFVKTTVIEGDVFPLQTLLWLNQETNNPHFVSASLKCQLWPKRTEITNNRMCKLFRVL